jgi:predicted AAA+ superfamily ATPase
VDFVVKQGLNVTELIQVCLNIDDPKTREREVRSLLKASKDLKCENLLMLTESMEKEEELSWYGAKYRILIRPLWKWLEKEWTR